MVTCNIFNLGADIGAMGAAAQMLVPVYTGAYILIFGILSLVLQVFVPYSAYVRYLKWLTVSLFAYVAAAFFAHVPWRAALSEGLLPHLRFIKDYWTALAAVLGTTISRYLFSGRPPRRSRKSEKLTVRKLSSERLAKLLMSRLQGVGRQRFLPAALSEQVCWRCRYWPARRRMQSEKHARGE